MNRFLLDGQAVTVTSDRGGSAEKPIRLLSLRDLREGAHARWREEHHGFKDLVTAAQENPPSPPFGKGGNVGHT